jgi:hypothetical protein
MTNLRATTVPYLAACLLATCCTLADLRALSPDGYALDSAPRVGDACHPETLTVYRGTWLRIDPPSAVAPPFAARLEQFEVKLAELGQRVYGRAPDRILHVGTYVCRPSASQKLSEHALGNAIDVTGFHFPALTGNGAGAELPPALRRAFTITVLRDYVPPARATPVSETHHRFFSLLRSELLRHELFRGVIGPPDPDHRTHFHLDMAPWPYERL